MCVEKRDASLRDVFETLRNSAEGPNVKCLCSVTTGTESQGCVCARAVRARLKVGAVMKMTVEERSRV